MIKESRLKRGKVPKAEKKKSDTKKETLGQRRVKFPFRGPVTKVEVQKSCHKEKQETMCQKRVQFPFRGSVTKPESAKNMS